MRNPLAAIKVCGVKKNPHPDEQLSNQLAPNRLEDEEGGQANRPWRRFMDVMNEDVEQVRRHVVASRAASLHCIW